MHFVLAQNAEKLTAFPQALTGLRAAKS